MIYGIKCFSQATENSTSCYSIFGTTACFHACHILPGKLTPHFQNGTDFGKTFVLLFITYEYERLYSR